MANIKTKRLWDEAWRKLSVFFSPSGAVESPFGALGIRITEPTTLRVETTGSDTTGDGSTSAPFRTVQGALEWLDGASVQAKVTIQVGVGSFPGFTVDGTRLAIDTVSNPLVPVTTTGLDITGTWVTPTLASGNTSGTTTSSVVTDLALVITDSTQSWTVDDLRGRFILISGVYYPVISNTATTATLAVAGVLSGAYSVVEPGTVIDSAVVGVGSLAGTQSCRIGIHNLQGVSSLSCVLSVLKVNADDLLANTSIIAIRNSSVSFTNVSIFRTTNPVALTGFSANGSDLLTLTRCYMAFPNTTFGQGITAASPARFINVLNTVFRLGSVGIAPGNSTQNVQLGLTTFDGCATAVSAASATVISLASSNNRFVGCTTAILIGSTTSSASASLLSNATSTAFFSGCTTILAANNTSHCGLGVTSGTGNTNGIVATKGARVQISNTAALGATNELSVDGTVGTLATLRAASPRVFPLTPNAYGTYIYE